MVTKCSYKKLLKKLIFKVLVNRYLEKKYRYTLNSISHNKVGFLKSPGLATDDDICFSELPNAEERLMSCEKKFKESYGSNMERLSLLKVRNGCPGEMVSKTDQDTIVKNQCSVSVSIFYGSRCGLGSLIRI